MGGNTLFRPKTCLNTDKNVKEFPKRKSEAQQELSIELNKIRHDLHEMADHVVLSLDKMIVIASQWERRYRVAIWQHHGHIVVMGSDGELRCKACSTLPVQGDYLTASVEDIERTLTMLKERGASA